MVRGGSILCDDVDPHEESSGVSVAELLTISDVAALPSQNPATA
jgi:hypothetical protein